jgi:DNA-binding SARP family transcriptional activator
MMLACAVLQVRCLGAFAFRGPGPWLSGPTFKRGREFLQYLVSYPRAAVSRDTLASAFWPELDGQLAAHRLHIAAAGARAALREAFPDIDGIRFCGGTYAWDAQVRIESDAQTLLEASRGSSLDAMREAVKLYNGEYLAGEHAEWMYPLRLRYANAFAVMLERLADDAIARRDYGTALDYALRLLESDRANESGTRLVMQSLAAVGRRAAALTAYDDLADYLRHHLALAPSARTITLRETILKG